MAFARCAHSCYEQGSIPMSSIFADPAAAMKFKRKLRARSPFLAWPPFIAKQPGSLQKVLDGLNESQWWSADELLGGQQFQLMLTLGWAVSEVPYYRRSRQYAAALQQLQRSPKRFWEEWKKIPLLAKTDLRNHGTALRQDKLPPHHAPVDIVKTSGSTGVSVEVLSTQLTRTLWSAATVRDHITLGRDFSKRSGSIRYLPEGARGHAGIKLPNWGHPVADLYQTGPAAAIHVTHPVAELAAWLRRFNPDYLMTYPSVATELLDEMGAAGKPPALQEIRFMSEPLDRELEERLEKDWGVRCADLYTCNETGYIATRCPAHGKLHAHSETVLVELLNEAGKDCTPGETGRVVLTSLHNLATPLIRYDIGDYAVAGKPCACGRATPVIEQVLGRVRNYARAPDGGKFWPGSLGILRKVGPIVQAQYVQTNLDTIEVNMVLERPLSEEEEAQTIELAQKALEYPYKVKLVAVEEIKRGPTGKFEEFLSLIDES